MLSSHHLLTHMVAIGEESGDPEQMLTKLSVYYDLEIKKNLERLTNSIGPYSDSFDGVADRIYCCRDDTPNL